MAAPLCVLLRNRSAVRGFAVLVAWTCLGIALALLGQVQDTGLISYQLGGWAPPLGIEYRIDLLNAFVLVIVTGISTLVMAATPRFQSPSQSMTWLRTTRPTACWSLPRGSRAR